jgi:hypothetical protein
VAVSFIRCEFESCSWRGVLDTTLFDKVCQGFAAGLWFSPGTPVSSNNKADRHNITEISLNSITLTCDIARHGFKSSIEYPFIKPVYMRCCQLIISQVNN